jgi:hypothetical protein
MAGAFAGRWGSLRVRKWTTAAIIRQAETSIPLDFVTMSAASPGTVDGAMKEIYSCTPTDVNS